MNHRACHGSAYCPTSYEHIANVVTHGFAVAPALFGLKFLLQAAEDHVQFKSAFIFGFAVLSLFTMSTIYHFVSYWDKWKTLTLYLHIVDRGTIYIFIASSYSPWLLMKESGSLGSHMRWLVWMLALIGIIYQYTFHERYKLIEIVLYIFIGIFPALSVFSMDEWSGIPVMAAGGMVYIVGVIFFKCDGLIPCAHAIWHLHVVIGVSFHYYAVHMYLMGSKK